MVLNDGNETHISRDLLFIHPHSLHRMRHTCRVCHFELDFAMRAGLSEITEALHCELAVSFGAVTGRLARGT